MAKAIEESESEAEASDDFESTDDFDDEEESDMDDFAQSKTKAATKKPSGKSIVKENVAPKAAPPPAAKPSTGPAAPLAEKPAPAAKIVARKPATKPKPATSPAARPTHKSPPTKPPATAPKAAAPAVAKGIGDNEDRIRQYMLQQNRPFNAVMVTDNLHKQIPKPQVEKILEALTTKKVLEVKEQGKQKIYFPNQDQFDTPDEAALKAISEEIKEKQQQISQVKAQNSQAESMVKALENEPDDVQLPVQVNALDEETKRMRSKLEMLKGAGQSMTEDDRNGISFEYLSMRREWKKRKASVMDGINQICDSGDKWKPKQLIEKMGIETDEEWKVEYGKDKVEMPKGMSLNQKRKR